MLKDLASQKKSDRDVILAAINSLKAKGWHINPYTVADEANISRSVIVRNTEYMDMVSKARGKAVATTNQVSDELMRQVDLLEEENRGLKDRLANITQQCELLAQNVKEAFQQGYTTAKAELALASGLQEIVRSGTADSGGSTQANDFSQHVPHAQLYTPQGYDQGYQGGSFDQSTMHQHPTYYQQEHQEELTADYPKPGIQPHSYQDQDAQQEAYPYQEGLHQGYEQQGGLTEGYSETAQNDQAGYQQQAGYQAGYEQPADAFQQAQSTTAHAMDYDESYDDQNVETAEHEVFISSVIPELHEDTSVDAFSARLMAALGTEGEGAEGQQAADGQRYDTGEFAETDIPDWDALADVQEEPWEDIAEEQLHQPAQETLHQPPPEPLPAYNGGDLSALGTSIPPMPEHSQPPPPEPEPAPQSAKFNPDDLRQLVNHQLEGGSHDDTPADSAPTPQAAPGPSKRFVGGNRQSEAPISAAPVSRMVPPEIRKACLILGIKSDDITRENVNKAWKTAMAKPGVHPDTGGDTEIAIYINNAKESLMKWLDMQAPKLGKKFGGGGSGGARPK